MQTFIESEVLTELNHGSMESFSESLSDAASKELGEEVSLFATHRDHAFGIAGDRVVRVTWDATGDETEVSVEDAEVPVINKESLDIFVAKKLDNTVTSLLRGDLESARTQLRALAGHVESEGEYWTSDGIMLAEETLSTKPQWLEVYEDGITRSAIRKAVHGVLGETEGQVPRTPYSRIPSKRLVEFNTEIRESLARIGELFASLPDSLKDLAFTEDKAEDIELEAARDSIVAESSILESSVAVALKFLRESDLSQVAKFHDILAERLKPMLVVSRFLARLSESESGDQNASPT